MGESLNITERTVCLSLDLSTWGTSRKLRPGQVQTDADRERIAASKKLIGKCPEHKALLDVLRGARDYVYSRSLPSPLKAGVYLLPTVSVEETDAKLTNTVLYELPPAIEAFIRVYPALVEESKSALNSLFSPTDYPSTDQLSAYFNISWRYLTFTTPDSLSDIDPGIFIREREKCAAMWQDATEEVRQLMRATMAELVTHMADRLTQAPGEKPKVFRDTLITNMQEFLSTFNARNVTDDDELAALVDRARQLLAGVNPDTLRKASDVRATVATGMAEIKEQIDSMVTDRPARAITFEDE